MNAAEFRKVALSLPETIEAEHMKHPDFRVAGKIFATLWPDNKWGMVKLTPEQQAEFISDEPEMFEPVNGAWGRRGATKIRFAAANKSVVKRALIAAWRNTAPKTLSKRFPSL
jgi:hypothetical protein